jgi:hypothetical protein
MRAAVLLLAGISLLAQVSVAAAQEPARPATARILIIRGVFNIFSTGLDELGQELRDRGYEVEVSSPGGCWAGALRLREAYERDPHGGPLVIIGHSMGGRACLHISRYLQAYGIPVKLVVIVDANPWVSVPDNVERCINLYVTNWYGAFHGSPVYGASASRVLNYDVTKVQRPDWADPVNHFSIDNSPWMHGVILSEIDQAYAAWRSTSVAAQAEGMVHSVNRPELSAGEHAQVGHAWRPATPAAAVSPVAFDQAGPPPPATPMPPPRSQQQPIRFRL